MKYSLHVGRGSYPIELDQHVRTRLFFALERFAARLTDIRVRVDDVNGPRGGTDKLCRIHARLRWMQPFTVEARADDALAAVDRATTRMKRAVSRAVERRTDVLAGRVA